jgi:hypothetical protein
MTVTELVRTTFIDLDLKELQRIADTESGQGHPAHLHARKRVVDELKRLGNTVSQLIRISTAKRWEYMAACQLAEKAGNSAPTYVYWHAATHPKEEPFAIPGAYS